MFEKKIIRGGGRHVSFRDKSYHVSDKKGYRNYCSL